MFLTLQRRLRGLGSEQSAAYIEYGLLLGLLAIAALGMLGFAGMEIQGLFQTAAQSLKTANQNASGS